MSAPPKEQMGAMAFFIQECKDKYQKDHPNGVFDFQRFSGQCAKQWMSLSNKERSPYYELADQDKVRYKEEMVKYNPEKAQEILVKKKRPMKVLMPPKRALSAFMFFMKDERPNVKAAMPQSTGSDIIKEIGHRWSIFPTEQKSKYEALALKDKDRYLHEMAIYEEVMKQDDE